MTKTSNDIKVSSIPIAKKGRFKSIEEASAFKTNKINNYLEKLPQLREINSPVPTDC